MKPTIFVSIAAYRDELLGFTVNGLFSNANNPDRIHAGIINQDYSKLDANRSLKISCLDVLPEQSGGACWARNLSMSLYDGEDFFLQIDSHTLFDPGWDTTLIEQLCSCYRMSAKPVISSRPLAFEFNEEGIPFRKNFTENAIRAVPRESVIVRQKPQVMFNAYPAKTSGIVPGFQISAALIFSSGNIAREIVYDPMLYFHGEEQNISIRLITSGWDIFHTPSVPIYHLYKKREFKDSPLHWDRELDLTRTVRSQRRDARANDLLWRQLTDEYSGAYGNGQDRPVSTYLDGLGLSISTT